MMPFLLVWIVLLFGFGALQSISKANHQKKIAPKPIQTQEEIIPKKHVDTLNGQRPHSIQHDIPEAGYVILNGVKRRIEDCKDL